MEPMPPFPHRHILGLRVDCVTYYEAARHVATWAGGRAHRYVCVANVHMVMEAYDAPSLRALINRAALVTADGMPLVWTLRRLGHAEATRVYGPDLTLHICEAAEAAGLSVALYGGTHASLDAVVDFLHRRFPELHVACRIAPPFRPLTDEEDAFFTQQIVASGAHIVLVGIGCPKQERWMAAHTDRIPGVLIGVGAAFDFFGGRVQQAPRWMQRMSLEWAFRLAMEPRRLWHRYAIHNPRFVYYVVRQLYRERRGRRSLRRAAPVHRHR